MTPKTRFTILALLVSVVAFVMPFLALTWLGYANIAPVVSLVSFGILIAAIILGFRIAIVASVLTGVVAALISVVSSTAIIAIIAMVLIAIGFGITARYGWNRALATLPIALSFLVAESPAQGSWLASLVMGVVMILSGIVISLLVVLIRYISKKPGLPAPAELSWTRTWAFVFLLAVVTAVTSSVAVLNDWGHTGGWLIMTPFIVMQPYVQDGWRKSVDRGAGTLAGFFVAMAVGTYIADTRALYLISFAFMMGAVYAMVTHRSYAIYAFLLTPTIVIVEGIGRSVTQTAENRLIATSLGVGIALAAMALAAPVYRSQARAQNLNRY
jgi:MFS family permease